MSRFNEEKQSSLTSGIGDYSSNSADIKVVKISNVLVEKKFQPLLANLIGVIIGWICLFSFKILWIIIGIILLGVCGFNCYDLIFKKHYKIAIDYSDGKNVVHDFDSPEKALEFRKSTMGHMNTN